MASPLRPRVEKILESGLGDIYAHLDPATKQAFKVLGETTTGQISEALTAKQVKVHDLITAVVEWLRLIPGANPYYVEQAAKIRVTKLLALLEQP